jgi:cytochrome c
MKTLTGWIFISAGLMASASSALASEELAKKSGCLACHAIDRKVIGPAYKDIAAKYRGDAGAEARLVATLQKGGTGSWGDIFMPPMQTIPENDIRTLVKWILSLK